MLCVKALSIIIKEIVAIAFLNYRSLYFLYVSIDPHLKLEFVDVLSRTLL